MRGVKKGQKYYCLERRDPYAHSWYPVSQHKTKPEAEEAARKSPSCQRDGYQIKPITKR